MMIRKLDMKVLLLVALFCLSATARAQREQMKLLTPKVGWALAVPGLMWTSDGGAHWKNIAPPLPQGEHITSVFFLDSAHGWVLLSNIPNPDDEKSRLYLAFTENSGSTWSVWPLTIPRLNPRSYILGGGAYIYFLDPSHGWINLGMVSGAAVSRGILIETQDGGRNWKWVASPGHSGRIYFPSIDAGWLVGGPGGGEAYATWDSNSWKQIHLKTTLNGKPVTCGATGTPHFITDRKVYLAASCIDETMVLFASEDGGRSWKKYRVLSKSLLKGYGNSRPSDVENSSWLVAKAAPSSITLLKTPLGPKSATLQTTSASVPNVAPLFSVASLSFADAMNGWALIWGDKMGQTTLLSTQDGGKKWSDITPLPPWKRNREVGWHRSRSN